MIVTTTVEEAPDNRDSHWSTRSMAKAVGLNQTAVSRICQAFGLRPHLVNSWKLSTDPRFIDKVRNIVGLHLDPPHGACCAGGGREVADTGIGPHRADDARRRAGASPPAPASPRYICRSGVRW